MATDPGESCSGSGQAGGVALVRRLRDKTNGCYGSTPSPPPPRPGDDASASDCLSAAGSGRRAPGSTGSSAAGRASRRNYIKKPLNAFMLFMKEMRQRVIDECTLKESAAINQILGRKVRGVHAKPDACAPACVKDSDPIRDDVAQWRRQDLVSRDIKLQTVIWGVPNGGIKGFYTPKIAKNGPHN